MKKIFSVIVIFDVLIATITWAQIVAETTLFDTFEKVAKLSASVVETEKINTENIVNLATELDEFWEEKEKLLSLVMNHNDLNKIGEQIKKIVVFRIDNAFG